MFSYLKVLVLHPRPIQRYLEIAAESGECLLTTQEVFNLWCLAKKKNDYIENHSNYHPINLTSHLQNEKDLKNLFQKRVEERMFAHRLTDF